MPIARKVKVAHCSVNLYQLDAYSDARYYIFETEFSKLDGKEFLKGEKYGFASQILGVKLKKKSIVLLQRLWMWRESTCCFLEIDVHHTVCKSSPVNVFMNQRWLKVNGYARFSLSLSVFHDAIAFAVDLLFEVRAFRNVGYLNNNQSSKLVRVCVCLFKISWWVYTFWSLNFNFHTILKSR